VRILNSRVDANGSEAIENLAPATTLVGGSLVNGTVSGVATCTASWDASFEALASDCS
jgi:hypothetical protein